MSAYRKLPTHGPNVACLFFDIDACRTSGSIKNEGTVMGLAGGSPIYGEKKEAEGFGASPLWSVL